MENAKCECTDEKESCDLESILKQQLGEYPECNCPGSTEIIGAKHLHCIIVISIKATHEKFVFQESQNKRTQFLWFVKQSAIRGGKIVELVQQEKQDNVFKMYLFFICLETS